MGRAAPASTDPERHLASYRGPVDMWYAPADVPHGCQLLGENPIVFVEIYGPPSDSIIEFFERLRSTSTG